MPIINITKINPLSLGKVVAIISGVIDLFFGAMGILFMGLYTIAPIEIMEIVTIMAAFLMIPVIYAVFGFIAGIIVAIVFNFISKYIGGLELEIEENL
ncbi:MAG: hypothetical protein RBT65_16485 [Methanolobus sp.]|jgi:hypothetical protein|nr:hypothetical protein [Methanolobus sp.]